MHHALGILHSLGPLVPLDSTEVFSIQVPQQYQWHRALHWHVCVGAEAFEIFGANGVRIVFVRIRLEKGLGNSGAVGPGFLEGMSQAGYSGG